MLLLMVCLLVACQPKGKPSADFYWLEGKWTRTNDPEGIQTYEIWTQTNDSLYKGLGFTMKDSDTVWLEHIMLVKRDTTWTFEVTGSNDSAPTIFTLTDITPNHFTCENPNHDFPKRIDYDMISDSLVAVISGDGNQVPFYFRQLPFPTP